MNIAESIADYLETIDPVLGHDVYIGTAPSTNTVDSDLWWIVAKGDAVISTNTTGEKTKEYMLEIHFRSRTYESVYDSMQLIEENLNCDNCFELDGYELISSRASTLFIDDDLDSEDRKVGVVQLNVIVHKTCTEGIS